MTLPIEDIRKCVTNTIITHSERMLTIYDNTPDLCVFAEQDDELVQNLENHVRDGKTLYYVHHNKMDPNSRLYRTLDGLQQEAPERVHFLAATDKFDEQITGLWSNNDPKHFVVGDERAFRFESASNRKGIASFNRPDFAAQLLWQFNVSFNEMTGQNIKIIKRKPAELRERTPKRSIWQRLGLCA